MNWIALRMLTGDRSKYLGLIFGVSFATLKSLYKRIKVDQELAQALWDTGNFDARNLAAPVVASEFVGTSITSAGLGYDQFAKMLPDNPHIHFFESRKRGYVRCDVERGAWHTDFRVVESVKDAESPVSTLASFRVESGHPGIGGTCRGSRSPRRCNTGPSTREARPGAGERPPARRSGIARSPRRRGARAPVRRCRPVGSARANRDGSAGPRPIRPAESPPGRAAIRTARARAPRSRRCRRRSRCPRRRRKSR